MFQQISEAVLCKDVEIQDAETKERLTLASLLKSNDTFLFFRFKENDCDACVSQSVLVFRTFCNTHCIFLIHS